MYHFQNTLAGETALLVTFAFPPRGIKSRQLRGYGWDGCRYHIMDGKG